MKRLVLVFLSLAISLGGIVVLFFLKPDVSPQYLQLNGTVRQVHQQEKVTFIEFVPDDFLVVSFEERDVELGNHTLIGRLQQYKGRVEFVMESYK